MTTFLVVNGPNLNMLGRRSPEHYGETTLADIEQRLNERAANLGINLKSCQSDSEAELVGFINDNSSRADGIIINPAGFTTIGYPLLDACIDSGVPVVEVHLSNIYARESWRSPSIFARAVSATIAGMRWMGYLAALDYLHALTQKEV